MKNYLFLFSCLFFLNGISQSNLNNSFNKKIKGLKNQDNLEEYLYTFFDQYIKTNNLDDLKKGLSSQWRKPKNNNEKIANLHLQINIAYYFLKNNNIKKSIYTYENSLDYYQKQQIKNYDIIQYCLKPLANNYTRIGDYIRAEELLKYTINIAVKSNNNRQLIATYLNLSIQLQSLGQNNKAITLLKKALKITDITLKEKQAINIAIAKNLYDLQQYKKSLLILNKQNIVSKTEEIKALCYYKLNNISLAIKHLKKALKQNNTNRTKAKIYNLLAKVYASTNKQKALENYQNSIKQLLPSSFNVENPLITNLFAENTFIDSFDGKATIFSELKEYEKAINNYKLSFYVSKLLQKTQTSQQSKIILQSENKNRSEKLINIYYKLFKNTKNEVYAEKAFQFIELSKSNVLLEKLKNTTSKTKYINDSLLIIEQNLIKNKADLSKKIKIEELKLAKANVVLIKNLINKKSKTTTQLAVIKQKINIKYPFIDNASDTINIKSVKNKLLENKQLLITYFDTKSHVDIFSISKDAPLSWRRLIKDKQYKTSINNYINLFGSNQGSDIKNHVDRYINTASYLYIKLLKPELYHHYKKIIIIPDGKLNFIPFDALLTNKPKYTNFENLPYLLYQNQLSFGYSSSILLHQKINYKKQSNKSVLGIFPVFENNYRALQSLKFSIDEKKSLQKYYNSLLLEKDKATKASFLKKANNYNILHLSTHASAGSFEKPAHIEFRNSTLYLPEIYGLNFKANLLVLSACETGIGKLQKGEGTMSLSRGFLYAGIKKLVVSQWKVNDKSTSILMRNFHKQLHNTKSINFALHQAKIDYLKNDNISNLKKTPYYWSSFMFIGNTESTQSNSNFYWVIILSLLIIMFLLLTKYLFKKKNVKV